MDERLQKIIANRGYCSRRRAEQLILEGKVQVNGHTVTELGFKAAPNATIVVEGVNLEKNELVYYVLNKPKDYISSTKDEKGRKVVTDLVRTNTANERVYPVGRLDRNTTGVLLLTNDGDFLQKVTHPKFSIYKTYIASLDGQVKIKEIQKLLRGVEIEHGVKVAADDIFILGYNKAKDLTQVEITIHDGRNHQVKKMFQQTGHVVKQLKRIAYGNITVDNMPLGSFRKLKKSEVNGLLKLAKTKE